MEKLKARLIVGWRERATRVRDIRTRARATTTLKAISTRAAALIKKKT